MQSKYIPLSEVVNSYLNESELSADDNYVRFYRLAVEGYKTEMAGDFAAQVKTVVLQVLANKTAILPKDYINMSRLGVVNNNGEIATFARNDNLTFNKSCSDDRLDQPEEYQTILDNQQYLYWASANPIGMAYSAMYGIGSNANIGEFRIDDAGGKIIFNFGFNYARVVLEYLGLCATEDGDFYVDEELTSAIKAYIYWAAMRHKKNFSMGEKAAAKKFFYDERRNAISRMRPIDVVQMNEQILKGTFLAPKG